MGSLLSSMPHNGRERNQKRRKKDNKKKHPHRRTDSSSSSDSASERVRHKKVRHHTSSSSYSQEVIPKGNVKNKTSIYNRIDKNASHHKNSPNFKSKTKSKNTQKPKGFDYHVEKRSNDNLVTIDLDLPELNKNKPTPYRPNTSQTKTKSNQQPKGFDYQVQKRSNDNLVTIDLDLPELTKSKPTSYHPNTSATSKMPTKKDFEEACIKAHNEFRRCHNSGKLSRDTKLTAMAQEWANKLAKRGKLEHSNNKAVGENVAFTSKNDPTGAEMCKMWYDEIKDYNFRNAGFAGNTGHFTQVVWKGSTHVGIGIATGSKGTFVVANYKPAGNITNPGFFKENVEKQRSKPVLKESRRSRSSSSSSSSSSDDDSRRKPTKSSSHKGATPKPGKTVDTKTETYTENGVRKKKTITTTTTVTVTSEGTKTSTETKTKIETLPDDDSVTKKLKKLRVRKDSSSSSSSSDDDSKNAMSGSDTRKFRRECLDRHNEVRRRHGASKLKESKSLQDAAQRHANKMLKNEKLMHTGKQCFGENVAMKMPRPSGSEACDMWYDEKKSYDFKKSAFSGNTGHFTQVVWNNSTEIGIGVASNSDGKTYVACFYNPPGNVRGEFEKNVKRG